MSVWLWIGIVVAAIAITALVTAVVVRRRDTKKVSFMMDALEDGETNFRFGGKSALSQNLNRIRGIFERRTALHEEDARNKLFRVMTHEIMNTVAPIASLSEALVNEDDMDIKAGLATISASSKELMRFVESYRNFMQAAPPVRKAVMVDEMMDRVLRLNKAKTAELGVALTYQAKVPDLLIYADEGQLIQVFNNLIKNAVQAGATTLHITADLNMEDQTVIRVANNGKAIPLRQIDDIFVPFYTTKPNGTGIGLSLSRQIMVRNHGNLVLEQSDQHQTIFTLLFK